MAFYKDVQNLLWQQTEGQWVGNVLRGLFFPVLCQTMSPKGPYPDLWLLGVHEHAWGYTWRVVWMVASP